MRAIPFLSLCVLAAAALVPTVLPAYELYPSRGVWPSGQVPMQLQLGQSAFRLSDGRWSWDAVASDVMARWNTQLKSITLVTDNTPSTARDGDGQNQVFWSRTLYGREFGDALAATTHWRSINTGYWIESDIVVNVGEDWDSYRDRLEDHVSCGPVYCSVINDLHRVLLHEFGHVLGLVHEEDFPTLMNARVSNINSIGSDEIAGIRLMYGESISPTISILTPAAGARLTNHILTATGTAADDTRVTRVSYQLNGGTWQTASGTTKWSLQSALAPGTNILRLQSMDLYDNVSTPATRRVFHVVPALFTLAIRGDGTVQPNYNGAWLELGRGYKITAVASPGFRFAGWTALGSPELLSAEPTYAFLMENGLALEAHFVPNPLYAVQGIYSGLFQPAADSSPVNSGHLRFLLNPNGWIVGSLCLAGKTNSFTGWCNVSGETVISIPRGNQVLTLRLAVDLTGSMTGARGLVSNGFWTSDVLTVRVPFNSTLNPANGYKGRYAMVIALDAAQADCPQGYGYAALQTTAAGRISLSGRLADGQAFSQSTDLGEGGYWPLYAPLYLGKGSLLGWIKVTNVEPGNCQGTVAWWRPANPQARYYAAGFTNLVTVSGGTFVPRPGRVLDMTNAVVVFSGGGLQVPLTNAVRLNNLNKVVNLGTTPLVMKLSSTNGVFSGWFRVPGTARTNTFNGIVLQNLNRGFGHFAGSTEYGRVEFFSP